MALGTTPPERRGRGAQGGVPLVVLEELYCFEIRPFATRIRRCIRKQAQLYLWDFGYTGGDGDGVARAPDPRSVTLWS